MIFKDVSSADKSLQEALQFKCSISGLQKVLQILSQTDRGNLHNGYKTIVFFFYKYDFIFFPFSSEKENNNKILPQTVLKF